MTIRYKIFTGYKKFTLDEKNNNYNNYSNIVWDTVGVGSTLRVETKVEQIMSDVYDDVTRAYYWDGETIRNVIISNSSTDYDCSIDVTPEVMEEVLQYLWKKQIETMTNILKNVVSNIEVGNIVEIVSGRTSKGASGKVFKIIKRPYFYAYKNEEKNKLGIAFDDEMIDIIGANGKSYRNYKNCIWVWEHNCRVKDPVLGMSPEEIQNITFRDALVKLKEEIPSLNF